MLKAPLYGSTTRYFKFLLLLISWGTAGISFAETDILEHNTAHRFSKSYRQNEVRLQQIENELETLPQPYLREPTGTGGFLTHAYPSAADEAVLTFSWKDPIELDAVALFPLRLFMDEIYGENLYWPGTVTIEADLDGQTAVLAQRTENQPLIRQSLPELLSFDPVMTQRLRIRCTDLPQHPYKKWHAAGFAEICIFSGADNAAPRAACRADRSRQGHHVLAKEFLTDSQTPLGLPELSSGAQSHAFVKKIGFKEKTLSRPYVITCTYAQDIPIDAVRIDPAIQHSYGQSFPVRFTVELLDTRGRVVQADDTFKAFPLRNPGLNPHLAYFPETAARSVRLTVLEVSQPVPKAAAAIAFSEITPLHRGVVQPCAVRIEEQYLGTELRAEQGGTLDTEELQMLAAASDGLTHAGRVLPLREWTEGLVRRRLLLEEQLVLQRAQKKALTRISRTLTYGSLALLLVVIGGASALITRSRIRMRKEIRSTRVKIASDLHDDVGSSLGAIVLHVERLQEQLDSPPEQKRLKSILRLTRESVFGLREVLSTSAPEVGKTQNIVAYMQELAGLILGKTEYTFSVDPTLSEALQDHRLRKGILLFYKEALYNAKRHAACSRVDISLQPADGKMALTIRDDGIGIEPAKLEKKHTLRTLKQRAEWLGAELQIESADGKGTHLLLTIPRTGV